MFYYNYHLEGLDNFTEKPDFVREYIEEYKKNNELTILLASHNMKEVERLCNKIVMMKKGKIVDQGTCEKLISKHGRNNLEETFLNMDSDTHLILYKDF